MNSVRPIVVPGTPATALVDGAVGLPKAVDFWRVDDLAAQHPYFAAMAGQDVNVARQFAAAGSPTVDSSARKFATSQGTLQMSGVLPPTYDGKAILSRLFQLKPGIPLMIGGYTIMVSEPIGEGEEAYFTIGVTAPGGKPKAISLLPGFPLAVGSSRKSDIVIPEVAEHVLTLSNYSAPAVEARVMVYMPTLEVAPSDERSVSEIWRSFTTYLREPDYRGMERLRDLYDRHGRLVETSRGANAYLRAFDRFMTYGDTRIDYRKHVSRVSYVSPEAELSNVTQPHIALPGRESHIVLPLDGEFIGIDTLGTADASWNAYRRIRPVKDFISISNYVGVVFLSISDIVRGGSETEVILKRYGRYYLLPALVNVALQDADELFARHSEENFAQIIGVVNIDPENAQPIGVAATAAA